jgi:hypothetical protein
MEPMKSNPKRGVLYIVWGDRADEALERSIASVSRHHPELPVHIHRLERGSLRNKSIMAAITPFETTLYLDADTIVMGNLDFAFEKSERNGLACCICEAPWMRRYGNELGDSVEYNTGVLFFTNKAIEVFKRWPEMIEHSSESKWSYATSPNVIRGMPFDDQAGFGRAIESCEFNPYVLPVNYNLRADLFHKSAFLPIKVWHGYSDLPAGLEEENRACEKGLTQILYKNLP